MMILDQLGMMLVSTDGWPRYETVFAVEPTESGEIDQKPWKIYLSCVNQDVLVLGEYKTLNEAKNTLKYIYNSYLDEQAVTSLEVLEDNEDEVES